MATGGKLFVDDFGQALKIGCNDRGLPLRGSRVRGRFSAIAFKKFKKCCGR